MATSPTSDASPLLPFAVLHMIVTAVSLFDIDHLSTTSAANNSKIEHIGQIHTVWTNTEKYTVSRLAEEPYDAFASDKLVCRTHTIVSL
jgi:hypothetical protein